MTDSELFLEELPETFSCEKSRSSFTDAVKSQKNGGIIRFIADYRDDKSTGADIYNLPTKNNSQIGSTEIFSLERFEKKPIKINESKENQKILPLVMNSYTDDFDSKFSMSPQDNFEVDPPLKPQFSTVKGVFLLLLALLSVVFLASSFSDEEILHEFIPTLRVECSKIISPVIMEEKQ